MTTLPGCTCVHAPGLHTEGDTSRPPGCIVGWSGAGKPILGAPDLRNYPAGCPCAATTTPGATQ